MANASLFKTTRGTKNSKTDKVNEAGGRAYKFGDKHALAQLAATGCLNSTFYASAQTQLDTVLKLCENVDPRFIAQTAVYARERGYMKDMPALLCAVLSVRGPHYLKSIFNRVINNGKMLRNFVQIMRSDTIGRKSLGSAPRNLVRQWLQERSDDALFRDTVGQNPSLADIIKMVHPRPANPRRDAMYGYLLGKKHDGRRLPELVRQYERFKATKEGSVPQVPFQMLDSLGIGDKEWTEIATNARWQMTRMNLRTFARHGVFKNNKMVKLIADRLRDRESIAKANVFPYQLMMAYSMCDENIPHEVKEALQDAMEISLENIPAIDGKVVVCPDVSGSMTWEAVTGHRKGSTSKVRCIDVAALVAASMVRTNKDAVVMPFDTEVRHPRLNPRDSVMTNANKLAKLGGGGTNCSLPLLELNKKKAKADLVVYVSDNQSWVDSSGSYGYNSRTEMMVQWNAFKARNPKARLVCIDIQAYDSTQAKEHEDILNVGGFSDQVFSIMAEFASGDLNSGHWVGKIEAIEV